MELRSFGPTGWTVPCVGLGGMPLSLKNRPDEAHGVRVIHAALDAGMRLIDTADVYCIDQRDIGHAQSAGCRRIKDGRKAVEEGRDFKGCRDHHSFSATAGPPQQSPRASERGRKVFRSIPLEEEFKGV